MNPYLESLESITIGHSLRFTREVVERKGINHNAFKQQILSQIFSAKNRVIDPRTVDRWINGERIPHSSNFSDTDMNSLISHYLKTAYNNQEQIMLNEYKIALSSKFSIDENISFSDLRIFLTCTAFNKKKKKTPFDAVLHPPETYRYINTSPSDILFEPFELTISVPELSFPVKYYVRHVQNGKSFFLPEYDRLPLNRDYEFQNNSENLYSALIPSTTPQFGFQFKCYAICDAQCADTLAASLKTHFNYTSSVFSNHINETSLHYHDNQNGQIRKFPIIDISKSDKTRVWFLLPNYKTYITVDPYINNYCSKPQIINNQSKNKKR